MPLPKPKANETEQDFVSRFMHEMKDEFSDAKQRLAVAYKTYREENKTDTLREEINKNKTNPD